MAKTTSKKRIRESIEGKTLLVFTNTSKDKYSDEQLRKGIELCVEKHYIPFLITYKKDIIWRFRNLVRESDRFKNYLMDKENWAWFRSVKGKEAVSKYADKLPTVVKDYSDNTKIIYFDHQEILPQSPIPGFEFYVNKFGDRVLRPIKNVDDALAKVFKKLERNEFQRYRCFSEFDYEKNLAYTGIVDVKDNSELASYVKTKVDEFFDNWIHTHYKFRFEVQKFLTDYFGKENVYESDVLGEILFSVKTDEVEDTKEKFDFEENIMYNCRWYEIGRNNTKTIFVAENLDKKDRLC